MSDLEKIRSWLSGFPGIPDRFQIDYTDAIAQNAGMFPTGMMEVKTIWDLIGNATVTNRYNFGIYAVFEKPDDIDSLSTQNAEWVMDLQKWVQAQSITGQAPTFGNIDTYSESIQAQNGQFFGSRSEGVGMYIVTISVTFKTYYATTHKEGI